MLQLVPLGVSNLARWVWYDSFLVLLSEIFSGSLRTHAIVNATSNVSATRSLLLNILLGRSTASLCPWTARPKAHGQRSIQRYPLVLLWVGLYRCRAGRQFHDGENRLLLQNLPVEGDQALQSGGWALP